VVTKVTVGNVKPFAATDSGVDRVIRVLTGRKAGERGSALLLIAATAVIAAAPVIFVFQQAFASGASGVRQLVHTPQVGQVIWHTVFLVIGSSIIAMVLGSTLAWAAHRLPPGRRWLGTLPFLPLVVPQVALVTGYAFLANPTIGYLNLVIRYVFRLHSTQGPIDIYTLPWITVVCSFTMTAFVFLFFRAAYAQLNQEILDAGATSGASSVRVFLTVVLPVIRPAVVYSAFTVLLLGLGQFTAPLLLGSPHGVDVLSTEMYSQTTYSPPNMALASAYGLPILVAGLLLLASQKFLLRDQDRFVTAGGRSSRPLTQCGLTAQFGLGLYCVVSIILPVLCLLIVALQPFWSEHIQWNAFTFANFSAVIHEPDLESAVQNSLTFALWTVVIALPLSHVCARVIYARRRKPVLADLQDVIVSLPLGIPAAIFGIGFLILYTQTPVDLYGESFGVVLLYVTIVLPLATRLQLAALSNLGTELNTAAAASGAGMLRRILTVDVPLLRPSFGASAALIVVIASQEFSASILVCAANTQVMGTELYNVFEFGQYPQAASLAILMCLVTAVGVGLAFLIGGRGALRPTSVGRANG
jgi:iron(III) transport system permease protein